MPSIVSNLEMGYTQPQLSRIMRVSRWRLRRWQLAGLFPRRERYEWNDLVAARKLLALGGARLQSQRMQKLLESVRARLPHVSDPLRQAAFTSRGDGLHVMYGGVAMEVLSGQLLLPFEAQSVELGRTKAAQDQAGQSGEALARQWFEYALSLEGRAGAREQVVTAYERCIALDPAFGSAYINLGTIRYHERDFVSAESCYRQALQLDPDYALAYFNLGNVLDEVGRLEEAIAAYLHAVRLSPGYADAHYNTALAYQRLGRPRRAIPHWQRYLGLDQSSPWAVHARTQLRETLGSDVLQLVGRK